MKKTKDSWNSHYYNPKQILFLLLEYMNENGHVLYNLKYVNTVCTNFYFDDHITVSHHLSF